MSVVRMPTQRAVVSSIAVFVASLSLAPHIAAAQEDEIKVDWSNPEIAAFVKEQAANPPRSLGPTADDKLSKVKLPVIGFSATPGVVEKTFRLGPKPAAARDVVVDDANPVWYQIVENYGDVTVSIEADLRVQHKFPENFPIYGTGSQGAAPKAGPEISVYDEQGAEGAESLSATYTVTKFGVPYTITVECSAEAKEQCRDTGQIAKDAELLKIIRANPPAQ